MKRLTTTALLIASLSLAGGCGVMAPKSYTLTQAQVQQMDFGPYPDDYQEVVKEYLKTHLKDPDSAKIEFEGAPRKAVIDGMDENPCYGYGGTVRINAKNSYGAYTGYKTRNYLIWHDTVINFTGALPAIVMQDMPQGGPTESQGGYYLQTRYF